MPGFLLPYHILSLLVLGQLASCQIDILISSSQPETAVHVSQSFVSLSIEGDRWTDWVGTLASPNDFFFNTLDNLRQLTGVPPQMRIGADSADNTVFGNVSTVPLTSGVKSLANRRCQVTEAIFPNATTIDPYPEATSITVDDAYYQAAQLLPQSMNILSLSRSFFSHLATYLD